MKTFKNSILRANKFNYSLISLFNINYKKNFTSSKNILESQDEFTELNNLLKRSMPTNKHQIKNQYQTSKMQAQSTSKNQIKENNKVSFELDIYKDLEQYYESRENPEVEEEKESKLKSVIKKISQSENVTIRKDENIDKYKISPQSEIATDKILNSIFERGTNSKFVKNIDKIYEQIEMEEINLWEKIGTAKNMYKIDIQEKNLSEIEEEIENEEKKSNAIILDVNDEILVDDMNKTISNSIRNHTNEENQIQNLITNINKIKQKKEMSGLTLRESSLVIPIINKVKFNYKNYKENFQKSLEHLQEINSSFAADIPKIKNYTENKFKTTIDIKNPLVVKKRSSINYNSKEFIELLYPSELSETIILSCLNLTNKDIDNTFLQLKSYLYDETKIKNEKNKTEIKKFTPKKNISNYLLDNYQIKSNSNIISIKVFKNTIFNLDKKSMNIITAKIKQLNPNVISIVYNTKRNAIAKENYGVFLLFADDVNIGNLIINCGIMNSPQSIDFFVSLFSLVLIENIQIGCGDRLLHFNFIFAKKFNLEFKLSNSNSKNTTNYVLTNLMDAKFFKLQKTFYSSGEIDQIFKEDGSLVQNRNYHIPNLKMFSMPKLFTKYFRQYFTIATQLDPGQICYKI